MTAWILHHFHAVEDSELQAAIAFLEERSRERVNLNITFKRLTAILGKEERAYLAEGLLSLIAIDGAIPAAVVTACESILTKLMLSGPQAQALIEDFRRKQERPTLPPPRLTR